MIPAAQSPLLVGGDLIFAVLDGSQHTPSYTAVPIISNGGLTYTQAQGVAASALAEFPLANGKRIFEFHQDVVGAVGDNTDVGIIDETGTTITRIWNRGTGYMAGYTNDGNGDVDYASFYYDGDWTMLHDLDDGVLEVRKSGVLVFSRAFTFSGYAQPYVRRYSTPGATPSVETFNFGQSAWVYDPGAGWSGWAKEI